MNKEKVVDVLNTIFGIGCIIVLLVSIVSAIVFICCFFVGPDLATTVTGVIRGKVIPYTALFSAALYLIGIIKMYVNGEKAYTL